MLYLNLIKCDCCEEQSWLIDLVTYNDDEEGEVIETMAEGRNWDMGYKVADMYRDRYKPNDYEVVDHTALDTDDIQEEM